MADGENDAGLAASGEHACRIVSPKCERFFAEYLLPCRGAGEDLGGMQRMGRCQQNGLDSGIGEDGVERAGQFKMMFGTKVFRTFDVGLHGTNDLQPFVAERSLGEIAAPAPETDDCG
jgi:hypothetical protein